MRADKYVFKSQPITVPLSINGKVLNMSHDLLGIVPATGVFLTVNK